MELPALGRASPSLEATMQQESVDLDPARQHANYMSAVARRNIDAPSAAVIAEETAASERQLEEHRKRRITTTHFDWQLDLGPCEGLRRDLARVAGMIFRTLWHLVTFTLYMEGMFILLRLIERVRRRREKSGQTCGISRVEMVRLVIDGFPPST